MFYIDRFHVYLEFYIDRFQVYLEFYLGRFKLCLYNNELFIILYWDFH
jgi:hypothetical protein